MPINIAEIGLDVSPGVRSVGELDSVIDAAVARWNAKLGSVKAPTSVNFSGMSSGLGAVESRLDSLSHKADRFLGTLNRMSSVMTAGLGVGGIALLEQAFSRGLQRAQQFQTSVLSIAATLNSISTVKLNGHTLSGAQAWNFDVQEANRIQADLMARHRQNILTYSEQIQSFQAALPGGSQRGLSVKQVENLADRGASFAKALGLSGEQVAQSVRLMVGGGVNVNRSQVGRSLGIFNSDIQTRRGDELYRYLMTKLSGFENGAPAFRTSIAAQLTNLQSQADIFLAQAGSRFMQKISPELQAVSMSPPVKNDGESNKDFQKRMDEYKASMQQINGVVDALATTFTSLFKAIESIASSGAFKTMLHMLEEIAPYADKILLAALFTKIASTALSAARGIQAVSAALSGLGAAESSGVISSVTGRVLGGGGGASAGAGTFLGGFSPRGPLAREGRSTLRRRLEESEAFKRQEDIINGIYNHEDVGALAQSMALGGDLGQVPNYVSSRKLSNAEEKMGRRIGSQDKNIRNRMDADRMGAAANQIRGDALASVISYGVNAGMEDRPRSIGESIEWARGQTKEARADYQVIAKERDDVALMKRNTEEALKDRSLLPPQRRGLVEDLAGHTARLEELTASISQMPLMAMGVKDALKYAPERAAGVRAGLMASGEEALAGAGRFLGPKIPGIGIGLTAGTVLASATPDSDSPLMHLLGEAGTGALLGGTVGSVVPGVGTLTGALGGTVIGAGHGLSEVFKTRSRADQAQFQASIGTVADYQERLNDPAYARMRPAIQKQINDVQAQQLDTSHNAQRSAQLVADDESMTMRLQDIQTRKQLMGSIDYLPFANASMIHFNQAEGDTQIARMDPEMLGVMSASDRTKAIYRNPAMLNMYRNRMQAMNWGQQYTDPGDRLKSFINDTVAEPASDAEASKIRESLNRDNHAYWSAQGLNLPLKRQAAGLVGVGRDTSAKLLSTLMDANSNSALFEGGSKGPSFKAYQQKELNWFAHTTGIDLAETNLGLGQNALARSKTGLDLRDFAFEKPLQAKELKISSRQIALEGDQIALDSKKITLSGQQLKLDSSLLDIKAQQNLLERSGLMRETTRLGREATVLPLDLASARLEQQINARQGAGRISQAQAEASNASDANTLMFGGMGPNAPIDAVLRYQAEAIESAKHPINPGQLLKAHIREIENKKRLNDIAAQEAQDNVLKVSQIVSQQPLRDAARVSDAQSAIAANADALKGNTLALSSNDLEGQGIGLQKQGNALDIRANAIQAQLQSLSAQLNGIRGQRASYAEAMNATRNAQTKAALEQNYKATFIQEKQLLDKRNDLAAGYQDALSHGAKADAGIPGVSGGVPGASGSMTGGAGTSSGAAAPGSGISVPVTIESIGITKEQFEKDLPRFVQGAIEEWCRTQSRKQKG